MHLHFNTYGTYVHVKDDMFEIRAHFRQCTDSIKFVIRPSSFATMIIWVLYDIEKDKSRTKVSKLCEQAGLELQ